MKIFCLASILATAAATKSAMRGAPQIVDLAEAGARGKNAGDPDATIKTVTVTSPTDPVGVTMASADGNTAYKVKVECVKGFSGLNCEINDNDCVDVNTGKELCLHKSICTDGIASFSCDCTDTGYEDITCSSASLCIRGGGSILGTIQCSQAHGTVTGRTLGCGCKCDDGWQGGDCSTPSQCLISTSGRDGTKACEHGSTIKGVTDTPCSCDCASGPGYEHGPATNCEVHSTCIYGDAGVAGTIECNKVTGTISGVTESCQCSCADGYEGHDCGTPSTCIWGDQSVAGTILCDKAHGTISGVTNTPCACTCAVGYDRPSTPDCSEPSVCIAGRQGVPGEIECAAATGTPFGTTGSCGCKCADGYEGADCGTASKCVLGGAGIDGTVDCRHGGGPLGVTGDCSCDCATADGYEGATCTVISDDCFEYSDMKKKGSKGVAKCQHNGACTDGKSSYSCDCSTVPYQGTNCETASKCINDNSGLLGTFECKNGGTVTGVTLQCGCNCKTADGYEGTHCAVASACVRGDGKKLGTMKCSSAHGILDGVTGSCTCDCKSGWKGDDCATAMQCVSGYAGLDGSIPCSGTGTVSGTTGSCKCTCDDGFEGTDCSKRSKCVAGDNGIAGTIPCSSTHGTVGGVTGSCSCSCADGYEGDDCSEASICIGTGAGSGALGFDAIAAKDGTLPCDLSKGDIEGKTGNCNCRCHTGFTGDACLVASACTRGDGVTAGTVKCHSTQGIPTGTTGTCSCDCTDNTKFHGPSCSLSF